MLEPVLRPTTVFTCVDQFDAMMTCIYDAWASRLGHSNVRLMTEPIGSMELFCTYKHVEPDHKKTLSVIHAIRSKISFQAYRMVYHAAMSDQDDKLDTIYRFLAAGFHYGASVIDFLQEPVIMRLMELNRKVNNEAHSYREFIRFSNMKHNILVSQIKPDNNILTLVAPHFSDRMPSENWMIIDLSRMLAIIQPADRDYYLTTLNEAELTQLTEEYDDPFVNLWKTFFESIAIKDRKNPICQRNLLPIRYREHMTEFI